MLAAASETTLDTTFRAAPYSVEAVETMNSELTALQPRRVPARSFPNADRESLVSQRWHVHRAL